MVKNLTARQARALEVELTLPESKGGGTQVFRVPPPSAADGEVITKMLVLGVTAISNPEALASQEAMRAALGDETFEAMGEPYALDKLCLGSAWQAMHDAGIWPPDVAMTARYAAFYWAYGETAADQITATLDAPAEAVDPFGPDAAFPPRSRSGAATASGSRTKTGSTRATGPSRRTSAKSSGSPSTRGRRSTGATSSSGGTSSSSPTSSPSTESTPGTTTSSAAAPGPGSDP